jgi:hypothetical protein
LMSRPVTISWACPHHAHRDLEAPRIMLLKRLVSSLVEAIRSIEQASRQRWL